MAQATLSETEKHVCWWFAQAQRQLGHTNFVLELRLRTLPDKKVVQHFSQTPEETLAFLSKFTQEHQQFDAWYGLQPRLPKATAGTTQDVAALVFYGCDFDHKQKGDGGTDETTHAECVKWAQYQLRTLLEDEERPAAIIDSGNCVQLVMPHKPIATSADEMQRHAARTMELGKEILKLAQLEGIYTDEVKDAARVLRLPGFPNPKGGRVAQVIELVAVAQETPEVDFAPPSMSTVLEKALQKKIGASKRYAYFVKLAGMFASHNIALEEARKLLVQFNRENCAKPAPEGYIDNALSNYERWLKTNRKTGVASEVLKIDKEVGAFVAVFKGRPLKELKTEAAEWAKKHNFEPDEFYGKVARHDLMKKRMAYGWAGKRWIETIRGSDGQPALLVCKEGNFLEWEVLPEFEADEEIYAPLQVEESLLYHLPPEPVHFTDEKEIDELILLLKEGAIDLSKSDKTYIDTWNGLVIPFIKHTGNFDDFNTCMNLKFMADYGSGKSAALNFVAACCYRCIVAGGQTLATVLRFCHKYRCTLGWNELEISETTDTDVVKLVNNRFQKDFVFFKADQNDQHNVFGYDVYGCTVASSRRAYADASTESRFVALEMAETTKDINLFFSIREQPDFQHLLGMLFYLRLKHKQEGIEPDQKTVHRLPISARSKQKYALLFPFVRKDMRATVENLLLKQEEKEALRRAESDEGTLVNAIMSVKADELEAKKENILKPYGVLTSDLKEATQMKQIAPIMKQLGFYEKRVNEEVQENGTTSERLRRRWFIKDIDAWKSLVRKYLIFTFDENQKRHYEIEEEVPDFSQDKIPLTFMEAKEAAKQSKL